MKATETRDVAVLRPGSLGQLVRVTVLEVAVTWGVRRALDLGYRQATGRPVPSARQADIRFGRVVLWAAVSAAAIAAANVVVDRTVLRQESHGPQN